MRTLFVLAGFLSGTFWVSNAKAQGPLIFPYEFPREVQAVLASREFLASISLARAAAEGEGRQLEIRHVDVFVGDYFGTAVSFLLASTDRLLSVGDPDHQRLELLTHWVHRFPDPAQVLSGHVWRIDTFPKNVPVFPRELSAAILHPNFPKIVQTIWSRIENSLAAKETAWRAELWLTGVTKGRPGRSELILEFGIPLRESIAAAGSSANPATQVIPYSAIAVEVTRQLEPGHPGDVASVISVTERPDLLLLTPPRREAKSPRLPLWNAARLREAKPPSLPNAPSAERGSAPESEAKPADVDLAKETKKSVREGKARREGKGREGKK